MAEPTRIEVYNEDLTDIRNAIYQYYSNMTDRNKSFARGAKLRELMDKIYNELFVNNNEIILAVKKLEEFEW